MGFPNEKPDANAVAEGLGATAGPLISWRLRWFVKEFRAGPAGAAALLSAVARGFTHVAAARMLRLRARVPARPGGRLAPRTFCRFVGQMRARAPRVFDIPASLVSSVSRLHTRTPPMCSPATLFTEYRGRQGKCSFP